MRARFTFVFLLLLVLLTVGAFLSYMEGFLSFDRSIPHPLSWFANEWSGVRPVGEGRAARVPGDEVSPERGASSHGLEASLENLARHRGLVLEIEPGVELSSGSLDMDHRLSALPEELAALLSSAGLGALFSRTALKIAPVHVRRTVRQAAASSMVVTDIGLTATLRLGEEVRGVVVDGSHYYHLRLLPENTRVMSDAGSTATLLHVSFMESGAIVGSPLLWVWPQTRTHSPASPAQPLDVIAFVDWINSDSIRLALDLTSEQRP